MAEDRPISDPQRLNEALTEAMSLITLAHYNEHEGVVLLAAARMMLRRDDERIKDLFGRVALVLEAMALFSSVLLADLAEKIGVEPHVLLQQLAVNHAANQGADDGSQ